MGWVRAWVYLIPLTSVGTVTKNKLTGRKAQKCPNSAYIDYHHRHLEYLVDNIFVVFKFAVVTSITTFIIIDKNMKIVKIFTLITPNKNIKITSLSMCRACFSSTSLLYELKLSTSALLIIVTVSIIHLTSGWEDFVGFGAFK